MDINKFWVQEESSWIIKFLLLISSRASVWRLCAGTTGGQGKLKYFILPWLLAKAKLQILILSFLKKLEKELKKVTNITIHAES